MKMELSPWFMSSTRMPGENSRVCHGCRGVGHFFVDCPIKRQCPDCAHGFQKCFAVERDTPNKDKFFKCCNQKCGFWEWCKEEEASGKSSNGSFTSDKPAAHTEVDDMSKRFESHVRLYNDEELLISVNVNVTINRPKSPTERETKGKDTT